MRVREAMTSDVVSVGPEATLKEVAEMLSRHGISGLPVVEAGGKVLGVVSEADIIRKEAGEGPGRGVLGRLLSGRRPAALDARTAAEAMTAPAITVPPERDVAEAAKLMTERAVNRLPVVDAEQKLIGIVTRADLVRAFVRSDEEIERELREDVLVDTLWIDPGTVAVAVRDGEVTLSGDVPTKADAQLLEHFAGRVPGVVRVRADLRWRVDEPGLPRTDPRVPQPRRQ